MPHYNEDKSFLKAFLLFLGLEIVLYLIIVYFNLFELNNQHQNIRKNPAIQIYFLAGSLIFLIFINRIGKNPK